MPKRERDKKRNKRKIQEKNNDEEEREIVSEAIAGLEKVVSKPYSETETSTYRPLTKVGDPDASTISDESNGELCLRLNYDNLQSYLRSNVAMFLKEVLEKSYKDIESVKESEIYEKLEKESKDEITRSEKFTTSLPVLCDLLLKGKSESENGNQQLYDDIEFIKNIWITKIIGNSDNVLASDDSKQTEKYLEKVSDRMIEHFGFGKTLLKRNKQPEQAEFCEGGQTAVQIGDCNTIDIKIGGKANREFILASFGDNNKVIFHVRDRRQTEHLGRRSDNELQHCRIVLRASPNEEWNQIEEDATKLDLDVLNSNPVLKENKISIEAIQKGCLVVSFNTANNVSLEESLNNLFSVMFEVLQIDSKLQKSDVSTIQVNGYVYFPENFKKGESFIFCHLSWSNTRTNCDIDVHVSVLMGKLIQHGFSSNVGERIELQIRYDVAMRHHSIKTDESWGLLTEALNQFPLILQNVDRFENNINLSFKCPGKIAYMDFVEKNGPIVLITKTFFETTSDNLVKLSVFLDTSFVPESVPDQGLVIYLRGLTDAAFTGNILDIIMTVLRERRQSQLKNVRELKIKANIEDDEGKGKSPGKSEMLYSLEDKQRFSKDLLLASQKGHLDLVKELLKKGGNPNFRNSNLQTSLHIASEENHELVVEQLVLHNAEIDLEDENHETPLIIASRNGNFKIVSILLKHGANIEVVDINKFTPLYLACMRRRPEVLGELLEFGADVNYCGNPGVSPLTLACKRGYANIIYQLLDYGADVRCVDKEHNTPLHFILLGQENESQNLIIDHLLDKGALVNRRNKNLQTPIFIASGIGLVHATQKLLIYEADVNLTDRENNLPLHIACQNSHIQIVQELLKETDDIDRCNEKGITPRMFAKGHDGIAQLFDNFERNHGNTKNHALKFARRGIPYKLRPFLTQSRYLCDRDSNGRSLLYIASMNGHLKVVQLLLESNLQVDACDTMMRTPLSVAAEHRFYSVVECLLHWKADATIVDKLGKTALHYAVKSGSVDIVKIIMKQGRSVYKADNEGNTPLHFSGIYGNVEITKALVSFGECIDVNKSNSKSITALYEAVNTEQLDVAEFLLRHGAKVDCDDSSGKTPLHIAAENGSIQAIELLLTFDAQINQRDHDLQTPVFQTVKYGRSALLTLINNGADLNIPDMNNKSPLHVSLEKDYLFALKTLVKYRANVNCEDKDKITPLHLASRIGNLEKAEILLKADASVNAVDVNGCIPLHYCKERDMVELLIRYGSSVNRKNGNGETPLHEAVKNKRCFSVIESLLENNADICMRDNKMESVIHKLVSASDYHSVVEILSANNVRLDNLGRVEEIVKECSKSNTHEYVKEVLELWIKTKEHFAIGKCMKNLEICQPNVYKGHIQWLKRNNLAQKAEDLELERKQMEMEEYLEKDLARKAEDPELERKQMEMEENPEIEKGTELKQIPSNAYSKTTPSDQPK